MAPDSEERYYHRNSAVDYLHKFIGLPYRWGGNDPMEGFDCSGLIMEILIRAGLYARGDDRTAHGIWLDFNGYELPKPYKFKGGCLVFWFNPKTGRATHVAMLVDEFYIIHAAGGGRATQKLKDAMKDDAYIKGDLLKNEIGRRLNAYGQHYKIVDPWMG